MSVVIHSLFWRHFILYIISIMVTAYLFRQARWKPTWSDKGWLLILQKHRSIVLHKQKQMTICKRFFFILPEQTDGLLWWHSRGCFWIGVQQQWLCWKFLYSFLKPKIPIAHRQVNTFLTCFVSNLYLRCNAHIE